MQNPPKIWQYSQRMGKLTLPVQIFRSMQNPPKTWNYIYIYIHIYIYTYIYIYIHIYIYTYIYIYISTSTLLGTIESCSKFPWIKFLFFSSSFPVYRMQYRTILITYHWSTTWSCILVYLLNIGDPRICAESRNSWGILKIEKSKSKVKSGNLWRIQK